MYDLFLCFCRPVIGPLALRVHMNVVPRIAQHSYVPLLSLRRDSPPNRPRLSLSDLVAQSAE